MAELAKTLSWHLNRGSLYSMDIVTMEDTSFHAGELVTVLKAHGN